MNFRCAQLRTFAIGISFDFQMLPLLNIHSSPLKFIKIAATLSVSSSFTSRFWCSSVCGGNDGTFFKYQQCLNILAFFFPHADRSCALLLFHSSNFLASCMNFSLSFVSLTGMTNISKRKKNDLYLHGMVNCILVSSACEPWKFSSNRKWL